ncbi:nucleotide-binding protein [Robbsia andropogonis]|uniref:Nucleotide-binding protein n=1 Tax=Robbsia andropogonis TaxID=28092 RepID=A0A0F5JVT0_9BURK|nr:Zn-ribbon domain-containing OB-fold protein [Robbsia andropogonis]KKB61734.1 nucleotide-binding protein [Robbsia andropogonis]
MNAPQLPVPAPPVVPETKPFWDGTKAGRLMLPRCPRCSFVIWYPRQFCPECGHDSVEWFEASGCGTVYSFTIVHRGEGAYRETPSYVLALVDLDEGPRVLTNIVDYDPAQLKIGLPLKAVFCDAGDDAALLRFRPLLTDIT